MAFQNLAQMFFSCRNEIPDRTGYRFKDGSWQTVTYRQAVDQSEQLAAGLFQLGIRTGDKVAIISNNCLEWALTDYAVLAIGALLVPVYPSLLPQQVAYILNHSGAKAVVAEDDLQCEKIDRVREQIPQCEHFISIQSYEQEGWLGYGNLLQTGKVYLQSNPDIINQQMATISRNQPATIIYTSGTTGQPKGALLTHDNFLSNIENAANIFTFYETDVLLSFLPLSHVLERMAGHYQATFHRIQVAYAESIERVPENILEVRPTLMISVPRLYEKMYAKILDTVEDGSAAKRKIFYWAIKTGRRFIGCRLQNKKPRFGLALKQKIAHKLVFGKLAEKMGGRIRFFVSGGAPLSPEIAEFFAAAGLYILEGYGLTETSPAITMNALDNFRFGAVGQVLPNEEVKIAEDGEILTRGKHVMQGYYNDPEATAEVIDSEGWFHTGDIGYLDEDGFLVITDRKKNIIVTSGGKNIAPQPIENKLTENRYIEQAVVLGDNRKYCTAVITLSEEAVLRWSQESGLGTILPKDFDSHPQLRKLIESEIEKICRNFASYEQIKNFFIAPLQFSIESGELTPSLKVKRSEVEKHYQAEIDALYN